MRKLKSERNKCLIFPNNSEGKFKGAQNENTQVPQNCSQIVNVYFWKICQEIQNVLRKSKRGRVKK